MQDLNLTQQNSLQASGLSCVSKPIDDEIISDKECKQFFGKFELSDKRMIEIKNNLIGVVNSIVNTYLDDFR